MDITERIRGEEALHRLNRELRAISDCNQVLIRAEDEQILLDEVCRIVCDIAGYRMAWVGYAEHDDAKTVRPVAWAGFESGYIADARLSWAEDTERGRGPAGIAIRSGQTLHVQDFTTDPRMAPWRESTLQHGYRSGIALPLKDESERVFGVLLIYSSEPLAMTPDEIELMEKLAGDLSFGINVLRARTECKRAEEKVYQLASIVHSSEDAIIGKTPDGIVTSWNKGAENIYGYTEREMIGRQISRLLPPEQEDEAPQILERVKRGEHIEHHETVRQRKDGQRIFMSLTIWPWGKRRQDYRGVNHRTHVTRNKRIESIMLARLRLLELANSSPRMTCLPQHWMKSRP